MSLIHVGALYGYLPIIPTFSVGHAAEALLIASALALIGTTMFLLIPFSFGYVIGFYFFTVALGYLWVVMFSRLAYDHQIAAASAFASAIAFLIPALLLTVPLKQRFALTDTGLSYLLLAIIVTGIATISIGAFYNFRLVGLSEINDFRERIALPLGLRYAISITLTALLPFAFACYLERRQLWMAGACLVLLLAFYPLTLTKMGAFAPLWLVFLALLARYFEPRSATILSLLLPIGTGLLSLVTSNYVIFGLINFRMLAIPSLSLDVYNDYFAHHELTHFCQVQMFKPFMNCPYSEPLGTAMATAYHVGSFNALMFATEGVASVGLVGAPLVALACGLLISIANSLSSHLPPRFVIVSSGVLVQAFINVPFTTAMLTHGAGVLFLLWYVTPKNALRKTAHRDLLSAENAMSEIKISN